MKPRVSLLVRDFKHGRTVHQRKSCAGIAAKLQRQLDRQIIATFNERVAINVERRRRGEHHLGQVLAPIVVHHAHDPDFIPDYLLRTAEA